MSEPRTSKQQLTSAVKIIKKHLKIIILIVVSLILLIEIVFVGNVPYAIKWSTCGKQPVVLISGTSLFESYPVRATILTNPGLLEEKVSIFNNTDLGNHQLFCDLSSAQSAALKLTDHNNITVRE